VNEPDSKLRRFREEGWDWVERREAAGGGRVGGAYLFFCRNRGALTRIAEQEVLSGGEEVLGARISIDPVKPRNECALELLGQSGNSEAGLGSRYADQPGLFFAGWRGKGVTAKEFFRKMCLNKHDLIS